MTIPDKLLSVAGTAKTFLKNFSIPCVWVAVIAATPAGVIAWKVKGRLDRGDIEEARADKLKAQLALSDFTGQLAANAAAGQEQARKDQEAARDAMDAGQRRIEGLLTSGFAAVRSQAAVDNAKLRGLISAPEYDCLRSPLPDDYLRMLRRPGGTVPSGGGEGASPAAPSGAVPAAAGGFPQ